jgi:hypothetical protein
VPDLHVLRYSRYMDATGTHRLRGPEDVARYAALITGADPMEFGEHHMLNDGAAPREVPICGRSALRDRQLRDVTRPAEQPQSAAEILCRTRQNGIPPRKVRRMSSRA